MALFGKQISSQSMIEVSWLQWLYDKGWHNIDPGQLKIFNSNGNTFADFRTEERIYTYFDNGHQSNTCRVERDHDSVLLLSSPRAFMISYLNVRTVVGYCIGDNGIEYIFNIDRMASQGNKPRVCRYESSIVTSINITRKQFPNITSLANMVGAGDMGENTCLDPVYLAPIYQYSSPGIITIGSTRYITDGYIYLRDYTDAELEVLT
jgi:hypothetical protein